MLLFLRLYALMICRCYRTLPFKYNHNFFLRARLYNRQNHRLNNSTVTLAVSYADWEQLDHAPGGQAPHRTPATVSRHSTPGKQGLSSHPLRRDLTSGGLSPFRRCPLLSSGWPSFGSVGKQSSWEEFVANPGGQGPH